LLAELDGFDGREGIAVIAASNRKDLIDPALLARLSDFEIRVKRPTMDAARAIFAIHLAESLPYSPNGAAASKTRNELIDVAVSRWYAPNADNQICTVRFRDGKNAESRHVSSPVAGRSSRCAAPLECFQTALRRRQRGLCVTDIADAVSSAFERLASTLTRDNLRAHLEALPQDVDIVAVHPVVRKVARRHAFVSHDQH
jgi:SpoVK/Ycf46/Vps4 family AAA+-type ATPase